MRRLKYCVVALVVTLFPQPTWASDDLGQCLHQAESVLSKWLRSVRDECKKDSSPRIERFGKNACPVLLRSRRYHAAFFRGADVIVRAPSPEKRPTDRHFSVSFYWKEANILLSIEGWMEGTTCPELSVVETIIPVFGPVKRIGGFRLANDYLRKATKVQISEAESSAKE